MTSRWCLSTNCEHMVLLSTCFRRGASSLRKVGAAATVVVALYAWNCNFRSHVNTLCAHGLDRASQNAQRCRTLTFPSLWSPLCLHPARELNSLHKCSFCIADWFGPAAALHVPVIAILLNFLVFIPCEVAPHYQIENDLRPPPHC